MDSKFAKFIIPSYGNRKSRSLSKRKKHLLTTVLPKFSFENFNDLTLIIKGCNKINFEIGFGDGSFLIQNAISYPDQIFIGSEIYLNGITKVLSAIEKNNLNNIILFTDDARKFLIECPNKFLNNIYLLFPDPWPKKKHFKRRIINPKLLTLLDQKIKFDSTIYIATDHAGYSEWICDSIIKTKHFYNYLNQLTTNSVFFEEQIVTKYKNKAILAGDKINYFILKKQK